MVIEHYEVPEETSPDEEKINEDLHRNFTSDEKSGLDAAGEQQSDKAEYEAKLSAAADRIKKIEELRPERWAQLSDVEKKYTLVAVGRELQSVYEHPAPPLMVEDLGDSGYLGSYGDGYYFDKASGDVMGADYGITMNEKGGTGHESLFGDNPQEALKTYAHEFRHSYQHEQAHRSEIPHFRSLVDDTEKAQTWSGNFQPGEYIKPEDDFAGYWNQPVESDARQFGDDLAEKVFGHKP